MKQKKLIFNFFVNRNWKKLTDSRKNAKILADNRKSHHPIETLCVVVRSRGADRVRRLSEDHSNFTRIDVDEFFKCRTEYTGLKVND